MDADIVFRRAKNRCVASGHPALFLTPPCRECHDIEIDAALAAARQEEREQACKDVCAGCRYGVELIKTWKYDGKPYDLWVHVNRETLSVTECDAAAIRARRP